jgi:TonB family protein
MTAYRLSCILFFTILFATNAAGQAPSQNSPPPAAAARPEPAGSGEWTATPLPSNPPPDAIALSGNLEMLTPPGGADFSYYLEGLWATVKRNWLASIPPSARTGQKGIVVVTFHIMHDGTIPANDLALVRTSGFEPLDRASIEAIRSSAPFQTLPVGFERPRIQVRITFAYNQDPRQVLPPTPAQQTQDSTTPARAEQPAAENSHPASTDDLARQMQAVLDAHKRGNFSRFNALIDGFSLSEPEKWLAGNFGAEKVPQLATKYKEALSNFQAQVTWVAESWTNMSPLELRVEPTELANPSADVVPDAAPPKPLVPVEIKSFRFAVKYGDQVLPSWVDSFIYENGALRFIGGAVPFWAEELQGLRTPSPTSTMDSAGKASGPTTIKRIRLDSNVQQAKILHIVQPEYPEDAKRAHIQGTVVLHAIIGKEGSITQLDLVSGPPQLIKPAMDAVRQWKYQTTLLSGNPVEVDTTISIIFTLGG